MVANNTTIILNGCIEKFKAENELTLEENEIFELFSLSQIMKNEDVTFENILDSITDGGNDGGIDSIIILHNDDYIEEDSEYYCKPSSITKLIVTQSKIERSFKEISIDKLISTFPTLFNLETKESELNDRFNPQLMDKRNRFGKIWADTVRSGGSLEVYINYACMANEIEISSSFKSKKEQLKVICKELFATEKVEFNCYSSKELLSLYQTHKKNRSTIIFKDSPLSINYGENGLGYIGLVKLSDYKDFLTLEDGSINDDLFESNVRHFQGKVDVNTKIKNTLENISDRDFWWLNNGITIIAEEPKQLSKKLTIENVQIVNGLQTSYSIYNLGTVQDNDDRSVLVKVIISNHKDIVDEIIEATNYQNAVPPGLLRATDNIQKEIEMYFSQKGFYYDRRKNYYKNQGKPVAKIFGIPFLAQAIKAIVLQDPHSARATPTSLLKTEASYKSIFKQQDNYEAYLNCCLIVSKIHNAILNIDDKQHKNKLINFKLHISMIVVILYLNKMDYSVDEISNINPTEFDNALINRAITKTNDLIVSYQKENPNSNIINVAKSADFVTYVKNNMK
ncbi:MAG: AIPR family protein [Salinivirgaceae bacterium]|nr:AIPR family protein [Salinivirgaceae bacterium]